MTRTYVILVLQILLLSLFGCGQKAEETKTQDRPANEQNQLQYEKSPYLLQHAVRSVQFLMDRLYDPDTGHFKRRYREGEARFSANMEDYAYFVKGLLDLYKATDDKKWLSYATRFTDTQIKLFYDVENGAFYDTRMEDKKLLMRTKESYDGARPSGNSVAITNLVRLSELTGNAEYKDRAVESIRYFGSYLNQHPSGMPHMLQGVYLTLNP